MANNVQDYMDFVAGILIAVISIGSGILGWFMSKSQITRNLTAASENITEQLRTLSVLVRSVHEENTKLRERLESAEARIRSLEGKIGKMAQERARLQEAIEQLRRKNQDLRERNAYLLRGIRVLVTQLVNNNLRPEWMPDNNHPEDDIQKQDSSPI